MPGLGGYLVRGGSAPGGVGWSGGGAWSGGGGVSGPGGWCLVWGGGIPACTEADTPPPPVDRHTLVKTLPWPNFVAAGNE